jgi:hypothetical protein
MAFLTWASVGEDGATVTLNAPEREAITALTRVIAADDNLSLFLIATGQNGAS